MNSNPQDRFFCDGGITLFSLSAITILIHGSTLLSLPIYFLDISKDFGGIVNTAATAMLLGMAIASLAVGWLLDRTPPRLVILVGVAVTGGGNILGAFSDSVTQLSFAMAAIGAGVGASTIVPGLAILNRLYVSNKGVALAVFVSATMLAGVLMPPLAAIFMRQWGWRTSMMIMGTAPVLLCLPLVALLPILPAAAPILSGHKPGKRGKTLLASPGYLLLLSALVMIQFAINGVLFSAVKCLTKTGWTEMQAITAYSLANLLGIPSLFVGGLLADRYGPRPILVIAALLLAAGTAAVMEGLATSLAGPLLFIALWGVGSALPGQLGPMLLSLIVPQSVSSLALGLAIAISSLIGALAPFSTDTMFQWTGNYSLPMLVHALLALASALLVALTPVPTGSAR